MIYMNIIKWIDNDLFSSSIGTNESVNFSEVLLTISQMFSEKYINYNKNLN